MPRNANEVSAGVLCTMLDSIDTVVVMFNRDMRATMWNRAAVKHFPSLATLFQGRATMQELIAQSYHLGDVAHSMTHDEIEEHAERTVAAVRAAPSGPMEGRLVTTSTGRVLAARDFRTADGGFVSTRNDITEIKNKESELSSLNARLEQVVSDLNSFTSVAAHDLRAPLRALEMVPGWITEDLAASNAVVPDAAYDGLAIIEAQARRMGTLIVDLLDYARLGRDGAKPERFDPAPRIREIIAFSVPKKRFCVDIDLAIDAVVTNPVEFDLVLRNLLLNAVKHHDRETGQIQVLGRREDNATIFEVRDDGPGVPMGQSPKMCDAFNTPTPTAESGGGGLGLSFVKRIIDKWEGQIDMRRWKGGRGCAVRFSVPDQRADTPERRDLPALQVV